MNGVYQTCRSCRSCISGNKFTSIPFLSWSNGCWIGDVPTQLQDLTYAEELVIARAHTTKCWFKLSAGPLGQRAAHGNVCIHPHEITQLAKTLPRPMSSLYDEIVVIFVSGNQAATEDRFNKWVIYFIFSFHASPESRTPIIVRRRRILEALLWLKANNPLYQDIEISRENLDQYPEDGNVPYPVQEQAPNDTIKGQSATYTAHGADSTESMFAEASSTEGEHQIPISATGSFDVEDTTTSLKLRKIQALKYLKAGGSFVKSSTSDETLSTRHNPKVYGYLWPTLFPYGVGMFEDPARKEKAKDGISFKTIHLRTHVKHCLQLDDRRFQTHLSFPFVMHNILMVRESSYKSQLAVRRRWWPKAMKAMSKFDSVALKAVEDALLAKKARKDYTRYVGTSPEQQAVLEVLRYVDLVGDHIEGSNGEVAKMREEIRAITRANGTPSIFFTLNPADTYNPLVSLKAGKNIDVDALFSSPDSSFTSFDRARALAENPVAGAEFFKLMIDQFTQVFLGSGRGGKCGVFGRVKFYYGVVEAQNRGSLHLHILIWLEGAFVCLIVVPMTPNRVV